MAIFTAYFESERTGVLVHEQSFNTQLLKSAKIMAKEVADNSKQNVTPLRVYKVFKAK